MAQTKPTTPSIVDAARTLYEALEPFDEAARRRIIASALSLFGMEDPNPGADEAAGTTRPLGVRPPTTALTQTAGRPLSPTELIQQKQPTTNAQRLAVFAYYRERIEGQSRFSRGDLKDYFPKARIAPPQNYDRDFKTAVQLGYIYEDGSESYLTSKGLEAVETGFDGKAQPRGRSIAKPRRPKKNRVKKRR